MGGCCSARSLYDSSWVQPLPFDQTWHSLPCFCACIEFNRWYSPDHQAQYYPLLSGPSCYLAEWLQRWIAHHLQQYVRIKKVKLPRGDPYQCAFFRAQVTSAIIKSITPTYVIDFSYYSRFTAMNHELPPIPDALHSHSLQELVSFWCAIPAEQVYLWFDHLFDILLQRNIPENPSTTNNKHNKKKNNQVHWDDFI